VFCGTALGTVAARKRAYYAGPGNAFYRTLWEVGLTPRRLQPAESEELLDYGIGLTDICKTRSGSDQEVGRGGFGERGVWASGRLRAAGGALAGVRAFVLPSTSGAARCYWDIAYWRELATVV
jgi:TDG/mug DNA glycosylase family protein